MKIRRVVNEKFWGFTITIIVIVLLVSICVFDYLMKQKYEELTDENIQYVAQNINNDFEELIHMTDYLSMNNSVQKRVFTHYGEEDQYEMLMQNADVSSMLNALRVFNIVEKVKNLYITNGENVFVHKISLLGLRKNIDLTELDCGERGKLTYVRYNKSFIERVRQEPVLQFVKQMRELYGNDTAIMYFELDGAFLETGLNLSQYTQVIEYTIVDDQNIILYDIDEEKIGTVYRVVEEKGSTMRTIPLDNFGWQLISNTQQPNIWDQDPYVIRLVALSLMIIILIAIWVYYLLNQTIISPIVQLSDGMQRIRKEEFDVHIERETQGEMGQLVDDFNETVDQLKVYRDIEVENIRKIKDAEYSMLQAQINPHFISNSLNAVKYIASMNKQDNIVEMIQNIWILMRNASSISERNISFDKELEIIKAYVHLEEVRYKGKFIMEFDIPDSHLKRTLPKYILQPIVENAIFHGVAPKKGLGIIIIRSRIVEDQWQLSVIDDGIGMSEERKQLILQEGIKDITGLSSVGMNNVIERMRLLYKEENVITIESKLGKGTCITLHFPLESWEQKERMENEDV